MYSNQKFVNGANLQIKSGGWSFHFFSFDFSFVFLLLFFKIVFKCFFASDFSIVECPCLKCTLKIKE